MRQLYLLRGSPGSGKTTFIKEINEIECELEIKKQKLNKIMDNIEEKRKTS